MESKHPKPLPNANSSIQAPPLFGFKFSTIGQGPSLLERISNTARVPPQSDQNPSQEQHSASHTRLRPTLPQPLVIDTSSVELGRTAKPIPTQPANSLVPTPTPSTPPDPPSDVKPPQPVDSIRVPDLQYPNLTPDIESPVSWESNIALPQPAPTDQGAPRSQPPDSQNLHPAPASSGTRVGTVDGATDSSALSFPSASSQNGADTPIDSEQVRRPVEHLFRLASAREERLSKQREIFDFRSGELSTFCVDAVRAVQDLQDKIESLKQQGEEMRAQAEQTLQEANKMRDMADGLISSAGTLGVDMLGAKNHVGRALERSEQMTRFVRKSFDWLAALRGREQEKIARVQAEIAEQDLAEAEVVRRQQELQQQLERRKIEEQQKKEAALREEERKASRKKAEELEAARKKAEELEAARKRSYDMRRAEVMAEKWRTTQAQAQSLQAEREKRPTDASVSGSAPSTRGSHPQLSNSPGPNSELTHGVGVSTSVTSSQVAVTAPSRSPVARTGEAPETIPPSHPLPSSNKVKAVPTLVSFVPAQTEVGRAVKTDSPLSSTTLASELRMRNAVEPSQHSRFNQAARDPVQEQMQPQIPRQPARTLASNLVEVKREPSVEALPAVHPQPPSDTVDADKSHHHQRVVSFSTASHDGNMDQHAPISSNFESHATSLHVAQTDDHSRRGDLSGAVSPQDNRHRDFAHDHVVPDTNVLTYRRQDSISSDRSPPRWDHRDRRPSSSPSSRERRSRSLSRSPPYTRKRTRSRTPRYEDHWQPGRPRVRPRLEEDWDRPRRHNGYDRPRRGNSHRPPRRDVYIPLHSPPQSPRHYRNERSPSRRYRDRSPAAQHVTRFANMDTREWRPDEYRPNYNARPYDEGVDARRITGLEEQPRWQPQERQQHSPIPSERDQMPSLSPRQEEVEIDLLGRINMEEADNRGRGRGRPPPGIARGGPNPRRGTRGGLGGRGRGGVSGPAPVLLSRMTDRSARVAPAPSLSDRMQQD
ncbi:hypothetical protein DFH94DRAFT_848123 [Russula ochroleuca]|jgi:hypothetical protein|uniref:Uncharacterized protein n=1 Tax=Russula ochroleuca TaxID=152965 RepID=A0A9P5JVY8_9AGAM|nr:hypothetical protein DFH94DRAFT_848123 [Russula ochroleuca]